MARNCNLGASSRLPDIDPWRLAIAAAQLACCGVSLVHASSAPASEQHDLPTTSTDCHSGKCLCDATDGIVGDRRGKCDHPPRHPARTEDLGGSLACNGLSMLMTLAATVTATIM